MAKTKKNLFEGRLNKDQQNYLGQFTAYVKVKGTSIIIEIPFGSEKYAKDMAEHLRSLRD